MSKKIKIILFACVLSIIVLAVLAGTIAVLDLKLNIGKHISGWVPECDEEILNVKWNSEIDFKDHSLNLFDRYEYNGLKIRPMEIFCINNERVYFVFPTSPDDSDNLGILWHIASVRIDGSDFIVHYTCNLYDVSDFDWIHRKDGYRRLAYESDYDNLCGGFYIGGNIYLRGRDHSVEYNITTGVGCEIEEIPSAHYKAVFSEDFEQITVSDCEQNITKTITIESMAAENEYAEKIIDIISGKTGAWADYGKFSNVKITGDQIIITYRIVNVLGDSTSAMFDYNFSSGRIRLITSGGYTPVYDEDYSFVIVEH